MARPDWMVPGARVAVLTGSRFTAPDSVRFQTIDRVLKRDVVLEDGTRFNADFPRQSGGDVWSPGSELLPADHERVLEAVHQNRIDRRRARARKSIEEAQAALRARSEGGARDALARLDEASAALRSLIATYEQGGRDG